MKRPDFLMEYDQTENALREELTYPSIEMKDGMIAVPDRPGLGIEVNEDALLKYALPKSKTKSVFK
jgi:D-galactarolactone cycloisomerase